MRVEDLMTGGVQVCRVEATGAEAARIMWDQDCGSVPLVDAVGRLVGVVTDRDLCMAAWLRGVALTEIAAASAGTLPGVAVRRDDWVGVAEALMARHRIRRLPVTDTTDRVIGIVSMSDLLQHMHDERDTSRPHLVLRTIQAITRPGRAPGVSSSRGPGLVRAASSAPPSLGSVEALQARSR